MAEDNILWQVDGTPCSGGMRAPWFAPPPPRSPDHVAIIGAGIAGLALACALGNCGIRTSVIEAGPQAMAEASGNPAAVVEPQVAISGIAKAFHEAAFVFARRYYEALGVGVFDPCGALHLPLTDAESGRFQKIVRHDKGEDPLYSIEAEGALSIQAAGLAFPPRLRDLLTGDIDLRCRTAVTGLEQTGGGWRLTGAAGEILRADTVVLACGMAAQTFGGRRALPLNARRGQISLVPATGALAGIDRILSYGGYLTPAVEGPGGRSHVLGATYDDADPADPDWRAVTSRSHAENRDKLMAARPDLALPGMDTWTGRTGLRAATPDQLPVAGGMVDEDAFLKAFAGLRNGVTRGPFPPVPYRPGLYVIAGLGSRGFVTAPLLAELIAAEITGAPAPLPRRLREAVHPARFLVRGLKRQEL